MRAVLQVLAGCCLCLIAAPAAAHAEWHFTPTIGVTFGGNTTLIDSEQGTSQKHVTFGGSVSRLGSGIIGAEGVFVLAPGFFQNNGHLTDSAGTPIRSDIVESSRVMALMGNVVVTTPRRLTEYFLRPFVSGGFGLLRVSKTDVDPRGFPLTANFAAFNIGGGAVGFFSQRTGIRFDFRYFSTLHDTERAPGVAVGDIVHLRYLTASVGVVLRR